MEGWMVLIVALALLGGCQGQGMRERPATRAAVGGPVNRETEEPATRRFMERGWVDGQGVAATRGMATTRSATTREAGDGR